NPPPTDPPKSGSFASSIPPSFVLSRNLTMTNTEQFGFVLALSYDRQLPPFRFTGRYSLATHHSPLSTRAAFRRTSEFRPCADPPRLATACHRPPKCQEPNGARSRRS